MLWDVDFRTAVAQAELEDRERAGRLPPHPLRPHRQRRARLHRDHPARAARRPASPSSPIPTTSATSRCSAPRSAPRCSASRSRSRPHELADPEKGSGIAMICTFGDTTDVIWWRELQLPTRSVVTEQRPPAQPRRRRGSSSRPTPPSPPTPSWPGKTVKQAQRRIVELLREAGELDGEPRADHPPGQVLREGRPPARDRHQPPVVHPQRRPRRRPARRPARSGARSCTGTRRTCRSATRTGSTASTATGSSRRQRFFGVPVPGLVPASTPTATPTTTSRSWPTRPRCPSTRRRDAPPGYDESQRGQPGGFAGDPDVMDTWATSSLTPQIATGWGDDPDLFERTFPMDLRPQAHEIIRTWLFSTVVRAHLEHDSLPWTNAAISGWVLDPDRKKMSKSKGNVVTPARPARAVRRRRRPLLGRQRPPRHRHRLRRGPDEGRPPPGHQAAQRQPSSRSASGGGDGAARGRRPVVVTEPLDRAMLAGLAASSTRPPPPSTATTTPGPSSAPRRSSGSSATTTSSWSRAGPTARRAPRRRASAQAALQLALSTLLRLFAPFLPFVTEEVWSWWQEGSVHRAPWPDRLAELRAAAADGDPLVFDVAAGGPGRGPQGQDRGQALAQVAGRPHRRGRPRRPGPGPAVGPRRRPGGLQRRRPRDRGRGRRQHRRRAGRRARGRSRGLTLSRPGGPPPATGRSGRSRR